MDVGLALNLDTAMITFFIIWFTIGYAVAALYMIRTCKLSVLGAIIMSFAFAGAGPILVSVFRSTSVNED